MPRAGLGAKQRESSHQTEPRPWDTISSGRVTRSGERAVPPWLTLTRSQAKAPGVSCSRQARGLLLRRMGNVV